MDQLPRKRDAYNNIFVCTWITLLMTSVNQVQSNVFNYRMKDIIIKNHEKCGKVATECYRPVLSYLDKYGNICNWKTNDKFFDLPAICVDYRMVLMKWGDNLIANEYEIHKTCVLYSEFKQCVKNNYLCNSDNEMDIILTHQSVFCDNLETYNIVGKCENAWGSHGNYLQLLYTHPAVIHPCLPQTTNNWL